MAKKFAVKPLIPFNYLGGRPKALSDEVADLARFGLGNLALQRLSGNMWSISDPAQLGDLATIYRAEGKSNRASRVFQRAIELAPDVAPLRVGYGETLLAMSNPGAALSEFEAALDVDPHNSKTKALMGLAYVLKGREDGNEQAVKEGLQFVQHVQQGKPHRADLAAICSRALLQSGDYDQTVAFAGSFKPHDIRTQLDCEHVASVHANAGIAHMALGDKGAGASAQGYSNRYEEAYSAFNRSAEWVNHLRDKPGQLRGEKERDQARRRARGFNGHSQNLLIRLATLKLQTLEKGSAPQTFFGKVKGELNALNQAKRSEQKNAAKAAGFAVT